MANELKPCPFCGHQPEFFEDEETRAMVHCPCWREKCGCNAALRGDSEKEVVAAWNTRADTAANELLRETVVPQLYAFHMMLTEDYNFAKAKSVLELLDRIKKHLEEK
jgi:predicted small metal-binding protein